MKKPILTRALRKQKNQAGPKRWNAVCRLALRLLKGIPENQYQWTIRNAQYPGFARFQKLHNLVYGAEHSGFYIARCESYDRGLTAHIFEPFNLIGL